MALQITNNATSTLASSIAAGDTAFSVKAGDGAKFPVLGAGDWFPATLVKASGVLEIVKVTARNTDVFTVVRGQEGTLAQSFNVGEIVQLRMTKAAFAEFVQQSSFSTFAKSLWDDPDKETMRTSLGLGTVATYDVQTALFDATIGRILKTGAFGLGGTAQNITFSDANVMPADVTGIYGAAAVGNGPAGGVAGDMLLHVVFNTNAKFQLWMNYNARRLFYRNYATGWQPWVEVYHTGNLNPALYVQHSERLLGSNNNLPSFHSNLSASIASGQANQGQLLIGNGGNSSAAAVLSFLREGIYGVNIGPDTDNILKVGGWSMGNAAYQLWNDSNGVSRYGILMGNYVEQVGAYGFFCIGGGGGTTPGAAVAGANMRRAAAGYQAPAGGGIPGTWLLCGQIFNSDGASTDSTTLCIRIA